MKRWIYEFHILEPRNGELNEERSSQLKTQIMPQLRGKIGWKIHASACRNSNPDLYITGAALELASQPGAGHGDEMIENMNFIYFNGGIKK